jgi:DNA-directed RNA polymerase beta subunit/intein/homing endonuclease
MLTQDHIWKVVEDHIENTGLASHQISSFDEFINTGISRIFLEEPGITVDKRSDLIYSVSFKDPYIPEPKVIEDDRSTRDDIYPCECRQRNLTYQSPLFVDVEVTTQDILVPATDTVERVLAAPEITIHRRVLIAWIPIMLRSSKCRLSSCSQDERVANGEDYYDQGGYFIIRGTSSSNERVLISQTRDVYNVVSVRPGKIDKKIKLLAEVRSMSEETGHSVLIKGIIGTDERTLSFILPYIKEPIPMGVVFKALGISTIEALRECVGLYTEEAGRLLNSIIRDGFRTQVETREDAIAYVGQYGMHNMKDVDRPSYAWQVIESELFPHLGVSATLKEKILFLGHIVNKLISTYLGHRETDDRDDYRRKRVEPAGTLIGDLFRTLWKTLMNNLDAAITKKRQVPDVIAEIHRSTFITAQLARCFPAGTPISLANGTSIPIEQLSESGGELVKGWNGSGFTSTRQTGLIHQGQRETVRLTFEDGRTLVCTPDHQILTADGKWVAAEKLPLGSRVTAGVDSPLDQISHDEAGWELITEDRDFTLIPGTERETTLAFVRILGLVMSDGSLSSSLKDGGWAYVGSFVDVQSCIRDYEMITGKTPKVYDRYQEGWGHTFAIRLRIELTNLISTLNGVNTGKKVTTNRTLPAFLLESNCPKAVTREFLAGLFGGDGHCPRLDVREGQRTCITSVAFSWSAKREFLGSLKETMEDLGRLLDRVGVPNCHINGPYHQGDGTWSYRLHTQSSTAFANNVGFRYCVHKEYKLALATSYWRMEENIKRQHDSVVVRTNELRDSGKCLNSRGAKSIRIALEQAREELADQEHVLNEYYSLSSERDVIKRREKGRSITLEYLQTKFGVPDAVDYMREAGAEDWFNGKYVCDRNAKELPYFTIRLVDIRADKPQLVYDIGVETNHSFLASGVGAHNCFQTGNWGLQKTGSYIRVGVSQILSRFYGGSISHLRRIMVPAGKESKSKEIRQLTASQEMFICPAECFDPSTPILMWNGSTRAAKDVAVGDILIDDAGLPTRVRSTISGIAPMYDVIQKKKNSLDYTVTSNHILTLKVKKHKEIMANRGGFEAQWFDLESRQYKYKEFNTQADGKAFLTTISDNDVLDITICDYFDLPKDIRKELFGFHCDRIEWPSQEVKLDPYILGVWLGGGFSSTIKGRVAPNRTEEPPLEKVLREYNLVDNKHIPDEYIVNNRETRLAVLAGLIDSDGNVCVNGHEVGIRQGPKNTRIVMDALRLARSLGFSCHCTHTDGDKKFSTYTDLIITGEFLHEIPTVLPLKKLHPFTDQHAHARCTLTPIEVIKKGLGPFVGWQLEGNGRFLLDDCTVVHNTPEGQSVGIVLNLALLTRISTRIPTVLVKQAVENIESLILTNDLDQSNNLVKVFVNGALLGFVENTEEFIREFKARRKVQDIPRDVSIAFDDFDEEILIYSDEGRLLRPVFPIVGDKLLATVDMGTSWEELVIKGAIVYVDNSEANTSTFVFTQEEIGMFHADFCEIVPVGIMGAVASTLPFPDHTPSPRVCYSASMAKQVMGCFALSARVRCDTVVHSLDYPQKPIVSTKPADFMHFNDMPQGVNAIVAIACYGGSNQEDSVIMNQSAIERGLFTANTFRCHTEEDKRPGTFVLFQIGLCPMNKRKKDLNYSLLDDTGVIRKRLERVETVVDTHGVEHHRTIRDLVYVNKGDVIIGKTLTKTDKSTNVSTTTDCSVAIKAGEEGWIDRIFESTTPNGYRMVKVVIRTPKPPEVGDKMAARSAQKGTIGSVMKQEDMPFTREGIVPDIIMNPHAIPSRMTINQLLECVLGKSCCYSSTLGDATAFEHGPNIAEEICQKLEDVLETKKDKALSVMAEMSVLNYSSFDQRYGTEYMTNGMSGEMFETQIFIGPTFYQRLKHLVSEKLHSRKSGPVTTLTRQPLEGRSRGGGLRFGEMERDCFTGETMITLSSGLSIQIKDMDSSNHEVLGFDSQTSGLIPSQQSQFLCKGEKQCVRLTFSDGRTQVCTPTHKLLTKNDTWLEASKTLGVDLRTSFRGVSVDIKREIQPDNDWSLEVGSYKFDIRDNTEYTRAMSYARIVGYIMADGHIPQEGSTMSTAIIYLGHMIDVQQVLLDIQTVNGSDIQRNWRTARNLYTINLPPALTDALVKTQGLVRGRKVTQPSCIPEFILDKRCPPLIVREFLGGLFGGDGHTCVLTMHRGRRDVVTSVAFSQSKTAEHLESLKLMLNQIKTLLHSLGVTNVTIRSPKENTSSKNRTCEAPGQDKIFEQLLHIHLEDLPAFATNVGFRYCCHKTQRLEAAVSYINFKRNVLRQRKIIIQSVHTAVGTRSRIATRSMEDARQTAIAILESTETLIYPSAIPSGDSLKRALKSTSKPTGLGKEFPIAEEFMRSIGALDYFNGYGVTRDTTSIPTTHHRVIDIRPVGEHTVYDIEVAETHSFLANGVVAHNCIIGHGSAYLLKDRLLDQSDPYQIVICKDCGNYATTQTSCKGCNSDNVQRVSSSFAWKLLTQELGAMHIKMRHEAEILPY